MPLRRDALALILAAVVTTAVGAAGLRQTGSAQYWRNYARQDDSLDRVAGADKYEPTEQVRGSDGPALPVATDDADIAPAALAKARALAAESHSMAFLIYAHGRMQAEDYGAGFSRNSFFDSYSSHKGVLAIAVPRSIAAI